MVDDTQIADGSADSVCPWCSAPYSGEPETCPSCGAALAVDPATDPALPGLTAIDPAAIARAKAPVPRPRNRLLSWISGDYGDDAPSPLEAGALALPDADVRREMLRLELEAEVANLQAEADALYADAALEGPAPGATVATVATESAPTDLDAGAVEPAADVAAEAPVSEPPADEGRSA